VELDEQVDRLIREFEQASDVMAKVMRQLAQVVGSARTGFEWGDRRGAAEEDEEEEEEEGEEEE
jgi:hypothetical protein